MKYRNSNASKAVFVSIRLVATVVVAFWPGHGSAATVVRLDSRITKKLVVPVGINGKEVYPFLLDTGASTTALCLKLAKKLGVVPVGSTSVHTYAGKVSVPVARMDRLEIGDRAFVGMEILCADIGGIFGLEPSIEGILGQDVLGRFNYRLDRPAQKLEIEEGDELESSLSGTLVPFESRGGIIYLPATDGSFRFILDSGVPYAVLYEDIATKLELSLIELEEPVFAESRIGKRALRPARLSSLKVGDVLLLNLHVYLAERGQPGRIEDGFLPVHLFHSIYVNNAKGYLILNPRPMR